MYQKVIRSPVAIIAATGLTLFTLFSFNKETVIDFFSPFREEAVAESQDNCFWKEQVLNSGVKQGVSICFENDLEEMSYEYYSIDSNGERKLGLVDREKFKKFFASQSLNSEINDLQSQYALDQGEIKEVRGISNIFADQIKEMILDDL